MFYPNLREKCANALETANICPFVGSPAERLAPLFSSFLGEGLQNLYHVRFGQLTYRVVPSWNYLTM